MPEFIQGCELSRRFYVELIQPLLAERLPHARHAAAFVGYGSDVLGFETEMSMDHGWCARASIFLTDEDHARHASALDAMFHERIPAQFAGHPTTATSDAGSWFGVKLETVRSFLRRELLGFEFQPGKPIAAAQWLTFSEQQLLHVTAGEVFRDDLGELTQVRQMLAYYPRDVWLYLLAAGWARIGQEEAFVGRTGDVGDEIGAALIASRLVRDLMRLCFLMERTYAPYSKWFGSAFRRLKCASGLEPIFRSVLTSPAWPARQGALCDAYRLVAHMHNELSITEPLPENATPFHERPFLVIHGGEFAKQIVERIEDEQVRLIAKNTLMGSVDQFSDSADLLTAAHLRPGLARLYEAKG
jgi:hypothetical protein